MTDLYRKRPIEVRAFQWNQQPREEWPEWANGPEAMIGEWKPAPDSPPGRPFAPHLAVQTLEGNLRADPGDWIIRGVEGEFYPCKDSVFQATYEPVD